MRQELVMGIDAGTESVRVGLFDLLGREVAFGVTEYRTYHPKPGWAEQNPEEWWSALVASTKQAMSLAQATKDQVVGISLDATACSVVLCLEDGTPLRNSLIWMDVRAGEEAALIAGSNEAALKYNGHGNVSPEWMPCKALWLKKHEPEHYHRAEKVAEFADWYMFKLTGRWTANICNTTTRWYYNREEGGWPHRFYEKIGLEDLIAKFPQDVFDLGVPVGGLTRQAAEELGLAEGTPIGQGGVDAFVGLIGLGVVKPGRLGLITGSSHLLLGLTDVGLHAKGVFGSFPDAVVPGLQLVEGGQVSTGSIIKWFRSNFCKDLEEIAKARGVSVYDLLTPGAAEVPPGSDGLLVLDYWQGNRTPYVDPVVRGMIYGLTLKHSREHIFRAIMEGIAYGTDHILQTFKSNGFQADELYLAGGASNSKLYMQIHADVSNIAINIPAVAQAPCLGSAILASVAAGVYNNIQEAAENMVRYQTRIEPNPDHHEKYQYYAQQYRKAYPQFGDWMRETTKIS
ncbi:FGGY-family carbohydrate kinase [Brevibacillus massiliensis]|uniref:FGGY-family carbohydrate kinase n=1 Tax=Brevibacillus massiliensis TaxID=1118054 RepID=UPI00031F7D61|nr:FGGY-family carbohydrate kinase [Brevibacillus massiliensis]